VHYIILDYAISNDLRIKSNSTPSLIMKINSRH
jgi:hypothetical protein